MDEPTILKVGSWETPATHYLLNKNGRAKITRTRYTKGVSRMEGVKGYEYLEVIKPITITTLQIGRETVMVDDPLQWIGMQELAKHCKGRVLIGGLGLGLILHALQNNKEVHSIHVIDNNPDVIELMLENIPIDKRIKIFKENFWGYIEGGKEYYDTVVLDIWWGDGSKKIGMEMFMASMKVKDALPDAKVMIWGHRDPEVNPAVVKN